MENWNYGSDPQNADFDDLPFDYDQMLITRRPMDFLDYNIVESWTIVWLENCLVTESVEIILEMKISMT